MKLGPAGDLREAIGELGALALADTRDEGFLAVEVEVERAGADHRFAADILHRGAVEAGARKAVSRRIEDMITALAERFGGEFGHWAVLGGFLGRPTLAGCAPH